MKVKNDKVVIREMEFDDLAPVFHLGEQLFTAGKSPVLYRSWDEYEIMERFISDKQFCYVAEFDKKIVGFSIGTIIEKSHAAWSYGYLCWIGIDPAFQGKGMGRTMINRMTRKFIAEGARMMMLDTAADNEKAINFFKKKGFHRAEQHVYLSKSLVDEPHYKLLKKRGDI